MDSQALDRPAFWSAKPPPVNLTNLTKLTKLTNSSNSSNSAQARVLVRQGPFGGQGGSESEFRGHLAVSAIRFAVLAVGLAVTASRLLGEFRSAKARVPFRQGPCHVRPWPF